MTDCAIKRELLSVDERETLAKLNVDLQPTGITFHSKLSEKQMRVIARILLSLKSRTNDEDDPVAWAMDDWLINADQWFGEGTGISWIMEEQKLKAYRDHLLMLAGATLVQIQHLEYIVNICCSFLSLKTKRGVVKLKPSDLFSADAEHRSKTLGILKDALIETHAFDSNFEDRLSGFVRDRNHFIHHFWMKSFRKQSDSGIPSMAELEQIERFISALLKEATELLAPFRGFYYAIAKGRAEKENRKDVLDNDWFVELSEYERDFLSILRNSEVNDHCDTSENL